MAEYEKWSTGQGLQGRLTLHPSFPEDPPMKTLITAHFLLALAFALAAEAAPPAAYKRDVPAALAKDAKIAEDAACKIALSRVGNGKVVALELEREHGKLIYSIDVKVPDKDGVEEVEVNAIDGAVIAVDHESESDEAKEKADDK